MTTWKTLLHSLARAIQSGTKSRYGIAFHVEMESFTKPPQESMGDISFACFPLAAMTQTSPATIAGELAEYLNTSKIVATLPIDTINTAGPYINITIKPNALAHHLLPEILTPVSGDNTPQKNAKKIMIEFSQANTHKAFHIGHVRGTVLGESLARILENTGHSVVRANYQGDSGMHVAKWIWCYRTYHSKEKPKKDERWIAGIYVEAVQRLASNPDLQKEVDEINRKLDAKTDDTLSALWRATRNNSLESFEPIYKDLGTHFDEYFFESQFEKKGKALAKKMIASHIATISEGATIVDLESYNLGVWVLLRSDGTALYSIKDVALAEEKFKKYKIDTAIYVVGNAQSLHMKQLFQTLALMKFKQAQDCRHVPVHEVRLPTGKMSSRTGDNILYSDFKVELVQQMKEELKKRYDNLSEKELNHRSLIIAIAALKYSMLKQDTSRAIVFSKEEALRFEGDTGPYLLYTYARFHSILTKGGYTIKKRATTNYSFHDEKQILIQIAAFPQEISKAASEYNPAIIARYAYSLAKTLNEYYHNTPILKATPQEKDARMLVIDATLKTLKQALVLLGIDTLKHM